MSIEGSTWENPDQKKITHEITHDEIANAPHLFKAKIELEMRIMALFYEHHSNLSRTEAGMLWADDRAERFNEYFKKTPGIVEAFKADPDATAKEIFSALEHKSDSQEKAA